MRTSEKLSFSLQNVRALWAGHCSWTPVLHSGEQTGHFYEKRAENHYSIKEASRLPSYKIRYHGVAAASPKWEGRKIVRWGIKTYSKSLDENPVAVTESHRNRAVLLSEKKSEIYRGGSERLQMESSVVPPRQWPRGRLGWIRKPVPRVFQKDSTCSPQHLRGSWSSYWQECFWRDTFFKSFLTIKDINPGCGAQVKVSKCS